MIPHCTVASGAGAILFCSVLEVTESINRYCLFFAAIGGFFAAGIFWGHIEKMKFPGGLVS